MSFPRSFYAYVGNTWSSLDAEAQTEMRIVIDRIVQVLQEAGMSVFASLHAYPPMRRRGKAAEILSVALRKEMGGCPFFIFVYAGASDGLTKELQNATDFLVPTLMLAQVDRPLNEMSWSTFLRCKSRISYVDAEDAADQLRNFLLDNRQELLDDAEKLKQLRRSMEQLPIVETIKYLRTELGLSQIELAEASGLKVEEVKALESDVMAFNPPLYHLAAVAHALGTDVAHLFWPPQKWQEKEWLWFVKEIASEDGWSFDLVDEFLASSRLQSRFEPHSSIAMTDVRREMRLWLRERNSSND